MEMDAQNIILDYRFSGPDIIRLVRALRLPEFYIAPNGTKALGRDVPIPISISAKGRYCGFLTYLYLSESVINCCDDPIWLCNIIRTKLRSNAIYDNKTYYKQRQPFVL